MRRAARADANQPVLVEALRELGATVQPLHTVGQGCPDLLVGYRGQNVLLEVKNPAQDRSHRALTEPEKRWHREWRGQVIVVETLDDVLKALGIAL